MPLATLRRPATKTAAPAARSYDPLSSDYRAPATRLGRKADDADALDPRVVAIVPALDQHAARLLHEVLLAWEAQPANGNRRGVNLAGSEVMQVLGVDREAATAARATLVGAGLIVSTSEDAMDGGQGFRPVYSALPKAGT